VFELVLVVQHWIVELSVHPHSVDDFEPALGQATQGIGVTLTFIAMVAEADLSPMIRHASAITSPCALATVTRRSEEKKSARRTNPKSQPEHDRAEHNPNDEKIHPV
jgi:hypothetical protein